MTHPCGLWPDDLGYGGGDVYGAAREPRLLEFRLRHPAEPRGAGRRSGRSRPAARRRTRLRRVAAIDVIDKYREGRRHDDEYRQEASRASERRGAIMSGHDQLPGFRPKATSADARRGHRAAAARLDPGVLRNAGDRAPDRTGDRRPAHGEGACQGADGRRPRGRRGLPHRADAERHHDRGRRPPRARCSQTLDELAEVCDADTR